MSFYYATSYLLASSLHLKPLPLGVECGAVSEGGGTEPQPGGGDGCKPRTLAEASQPLGMPGCLELTVGQSCVGHFRFRPKFSYRLRKSKAPGRAKLPESVRGYVSVWVTMQWGLSFPGRLVASCGRVVSYTAVPPTPLYQWSPW